MPPLGCAAKVQRRLPKSFPSATEALRLETWFPRLHTISIHFHPFPFSNPCPLPSPSVPNTWKEVPGGETHRRSSVPPSNRYKDGRIYDLSDLFGVGILDFFQTIGILQQRLHAHHTYAAAAYCSMLCQGGKEDQLGSSSCEGS